MPSVFESPNLKEVRRSREIFHERTDKYRKQEKLVFEPVHKIRMQIIDELKIQFNGKCAYCESPIGKSEAGLIDHFRPTHEAKDLDKSFFADHYWWIAYDWKNLYLSCEECSKYKSSWFPIEGVRARLKAPWKELLKEKKLLIDPCTDEPSLHCEYTRDGRMMAKSKMGEVTIELLKLNRARLIRQRKEAVDTLELTLNRLNRLWLKHPQQRKGESNFRSFKLKIHNIVEQLLEIYTTQSKLPFLGIRKWFLSNWAAERSEFCSFIFNRDRLWSFVDPEHKKKVDRLFALGDFKKIIDRYESSPIKPIKEQARISYKESVAKRVFIERIEIKNFKVIKDITVDFPEPGSGDQGWLMLLGENGAGKSTFLEAFAIAMAGNDYLKNFNLKAKNLLTHGEKEGSIKIYLIGGNEPIEARFNVKSNVVKVSIKKPGTYFLAYGSTRLFPKGSFQPERTKGMVRAKNLMNPNVALVDAKKWMLKLNEDKFQYVARALRSVMLLSNEDHIVREDHEIQIVYKDGGHATLDELSDGYQSVVALTVDIMEKLLTDDTSTESAEGIVLIDEIGTHLHPRWKMRIVRTLREIFRKVQVIATTHDPLCLKGMKQGEVMVFKKDSGGKVTVKKDLPDPAAFTADQLLSSEFFGLYSTLDPEIEDAFEEYYTLLGMSKRSAEDETRLDALKGLLKDKDQLGASLREELMFEAIDSYLIEKEDPVKHTDQIKLKEATIKRLQDILGDPLPGEPINL